MPHGRVDPGVRYCAGDAAGRRAPPGTLPLNEVNQGGPVSDDRERHEPLNPYGDRREDEGEVAPLS